MCLDCWRFMTLSSPAVTDVAVLNTQHNVGAGAAAGALLQQAAALQRRRHACHHPFPDTPCLAVVVDVPLTPVVRPMPYHLLWPCVVVENIFAIEGVDRNVVLHSAIAKNVVPIVKQNLILQVDYWQIVPVGAVNNAVEIF